MDGQTTRATEAASILAEHDVREHRVVHVDAVLADLAKDFPVKADFQETYQEVANFLRSADLPQKDVERLLRLLRRKCLRFMKLSVALKKWSDLNA